MRAFRHHIPRRSMAGEPLTEPVEIEGRALVTGGTGFVGAAVAAALAQAGAQVRVLARAASDRRNLDGLPVEVVTGDLRG